MSRFPVTRMRRLRAVEPLREMLVETRVCREQLIAPLFVRDADESRPIPSMPGHVQHSIDDAVETARRWAGKGLRGVLLFGIPGRKDAIGSEAWSDAGAVQQLTSRLRRDVPELVIFTDVCLCEYTDHGHCGMLRANGRVDVDNDATLESLARTAVSQAHAGAHVVAPSAMMDGQVGTIRSALDEAELTDTAILSYAVKFASSLYGPFRDAAGSAPSSGDRRGYQMDYRAAGQAVREATLDVEEGADMLMVKPAAACLDLIAEVRRRFDLPLAAYHVSGEYAMIRAAAAAGWLDEQAVAVEITTAIRRAGADLIITYFAEQLAEWLGR